MTTTLPDPPKLPNPPVNFGHNQVYTAPYKIQPQSPQRLEHYFDNPFGTAFKMTMGVLIALTGWMVFWTIIWITLFSAMLSSIGQ